MKIEPRSFIVLTKPCNNLDENNIKHNSSLKENTT
jgi:hypothetical protein